MAKEIITTGKTMEEALKKAYAELGATAEQCEVEVLEKLKKSLFGKIKVEAKVRVSLKEMEKPSVSSTAPVLAPAAVEDVSAPEGNAKLVAALAYMKEILKNMDLPNVYIRVDERPEYAILTLEGENLGVLIGRHGETLDALQYLTSLVCNRVEGNYYRITLDCGKYREKREEALKELAKKISVKVRRTGKSQMLEPMNPYERRIIHAVLSDVEGVTSKSKGDEPNRKVVIIPTNKNRTATFRPNTNKAPSVKRQPERTMEEILKAEKPQQIEKFERTEYEPGSSGIPNIGKPERKDKSPLSDTEKNTKLYSKIEL